MLGTRRHTDPRETGTGELVRWLVDDVDVLVNKKVALARQEATENLRSVLGGGKVLIAGAVLLLGAYIAAIVLVVAVLSLFLLFWAAALITLVVFGALGFGLALIGWSRVRIQPLAETRESLRGDAEWVRHRVTPGER